VTTPTDDGWHFIGKHAMRFEPPDIVYSRPDGDISVENVKQMLAFLDTLPKPEKGFYALLDTAHAGRQDPATMKTPEIQDRMHVYRAMVYFNADFHHRTIIGLYQRVGRLLKFTTANIPVRICNTEAEARAWIEGERKKP
jgi:hypothetical protein